MKEERIRKNMLTRVMASSFIMCLLSFSTAAAQTVNFGIKGGLDAAEMKLKGDFFDTSNRVGWFIGPSVRAAIPFLGFDVSLLYSQRESKIEIEKYTVNDGWQTYNMPRSLSETVKTQQIILPINARFSFGMGDRAGIYLFAGPQLAFNIGDSDKKLFDQVGEWTVNSSNFSVNIGGGVQFGHVQISVNYNAAIGNTGEVKRKSFSENYQETVDTWDSKFNAWQMALAYYF
jgi:hypothetical protein